MKETKPIRFKEANGMLYGNNGVFDLPVCRTIEGNTCSCWRIPLARRLRVLLTGCVYRVVKGPTHPPLYIETGAFHNGHVK
jgi:hypothetical protein